jgi:hypothetical protein
VIGGKNYPISHRAGSGEESPPVQIEGFRIDLDRRPEGRRLSPQALVQEYLNNSDSHLWGIVSNGFLLRLLRDTSRTSRPSYLEFDLQSILDGNRFNEFALFYRICHRTRLPRTAEDSTSCWLEKYFQLSIEQGGRVRDKLRDGVEDALKTLGTGFLRHPRNEQRFAHAVSKGKLSSNMSLFTTRPKARFSKSLHHRRGSFSWVECTIECSHDAQMYVTSPVDGLTTAAYLARAGNNASPYCKPNLFHCRVSGNRPELRTGGTLSLGMYNVIPRSIDA